ncbi:hypothetical protein JCM15519_00780 [Fundidesulfovibrio butyratiphilus]
MDDKDLFGIGNEREKMSDERKALQKGKAMNKDKRIRSRVDATIDAVIVSGGRTASLETRNVSLKGMLCDHAPGLGGSGACVVRITLSPTVGFEIEARIIRNDPSGLALDFTGMDEEAFGHLRRLVRLHASDADAIDREMAVPAFVKRS